MKWLAKVLRRAPVIPKLKAPRRPEKVKADEKLKGHFCNIRSRKGVFASERVELRGVVYNNSVVRSV